MQSKQTSAMIVKLACLQLVATLCFSAVIYYCYDAHQAISALLGGLIAVLSSVYMAGRLFKSRGRPAEEMLGLFYSSVVLKAVFVITMMAICIIVVKVSFLSFIVSYFVSAAVVNWLFLLVPDK